MGQHRCFIQTETEAKTGKAGALTTALQWRGGGRGMGGAYTLKTKQGKNRNVQRASYSPEQKAEVLAAILLGESMRSASARLGIPFSTIRSWQVEDLPRAQNVIESETKDALGELVTEYVRESLRTLRLQAGVFAGRDWLEKQNAADVAILHGVMADKTIRVLSAIHAVG